MTVQAVVLASVRARLEAALVVTACAAPLGALAGLGPAIGCTSVAVMVAAFIVVQRKVHAGTAVTLPVAAVLVAAGEFIVQARADAPLVSSLIGSLVQGLGTVGLPALIAFLVVTRRESREARAGSLRAEAGQRAALIEAAVARERTAMARELHDIAAHHLTGIAVMSAAISKQIDRDPAGAKRSVDLVREQSTAMLRDMRGLVGLLRMDDDVGTQAPPQESLDGLATLVESAIRRGEPVELRVRDAIGSDPRPGVGPLAQLAAYRTVQEALTNAGRHAPGRPCHVELDLRSEREVRVSVVNELADGGSASIGRGGGFGLVGMQERADLTGCRLTYGEVDGAWRVELVVPVRDDPQLDTQPADGDSS